MAVSPTFDNDAVGTTGAVPFTTSFTVASNPNPALFVGLYIPPAATSFPSVPTVGGVSMTLLTNNAGPTGTFGGIFVYYMLNAPTGAQTISFNAATGASTYYEIYSYYNVHYIDVSSVTQGVYGASNITLSLTAVSNNTLIWGVGGANDTNSHFPQFTGPVNNIRSLSGSPNVSAGDFGVQSTPVSETFTVFPQVGGAGEGVAALVALAGSQVYRISPVVGSYSLVGRSIILTLNKLYTLSTTAGKYALTGFNVLFSYIPYKWQLVPKASTGSWTNIAKSTVPAQTIISTTVGSPIGLLLALTYTTSSSTTTGGWSNVTKSVTPNSWTNVPKAT